MVEQKEEITAWDKKIGVYMTVDGLKSKREWRL